MSTNLLAIRDAVLTRAQATAVFNGIFKADQPSLDTADLPVLLVFTGDEDYGPDGDANVAVPRYLTTGTVLISVVRGLTDPVTLDGQSDTDVDSILDALLTDLTFVGDPPAGPGLFESVPRIRRRRLYRQQAETYLVETRLELDFQYRLYFAPVLTTPLQNISISLGGPLISPELDYSQAEASEFIPGLNQ